MTEETHDAVNHPSHYTSHPSGIECIEITRHHSFSIGNAIKYLWRAGLKDEDTTVEDLRKAIWYIEDEIKRISPPEPEPEPLVGVVTPEQAHRWVYSTGPTATANAGTNATYVYNPAPRTKPDDGDDGEAQAVPC